MKSRVFSIILVFSTLIFTTATNVSAASWYAGVIKPGYTYSGIATEIKTPTSLPSLGSSGESCWVSNVTSSRYWVQTGIRYYPGYTGFKTYLEHNLSGDYGMQEIGMQVLDFSVQYKVAYDSTDGKWHGFIDGYDKGSWSLGSSQNVQANGESHATNSQLGPFIYSSMVYRNASGGTYDWNLNNTAPTAQSPYNVSITDNANFKVY